MNELEKHVLEIIGESTTSPDVFLDTDAGMEPIRDSINDAIQEITALTGSVKETYYIPLVTGQMFYRISFTNGFFGWVTDAWLVNQKRRLVQTDVLKLSRDDPRWMLTNGSPEQYMQIGENTLGVYRKPGGSDDMIELTVVTIPKRYETDKDRVKLRDTFKWAAVHYAVSEYWVSRGDVKAADFDLSKYIDEMGIQNMYPSAQERFYTFNTRR